METETAESPKDLGHEPVAPSMSGIVISIVALLGMVALSLVVVALVLSLFSKTHENKITTARNESPASLSATTPALDPHEADDLAQLRERQTALLSQYKWLDRQTGVARIPIARAIEIMSKETATTIPKPVGQGTKP